MGNLRAWSQTASGNASIAGGASTINFAEAQAPSTLNNSIRETLAQIRKQYMNQQWIWIEHSATCSVNSQTVYKISGDQTAAHVVNRTIRLTGGSTTLYATIVSSSYTSETAVTITGATGSLSNSMSIAALSAVMSQAVPGAGTTAATIDGSNSWTNTNSFSATTAFGVTVHNGVAAFNATASFSSVANFNSTMSVSGAANFKSSVNISATASIGFLNLGGASYGGVLQVVNTQTGAVATGTTLIPDDDTIPQSSEGTQFMTLAITPKATTNKLIIEVQINGGLSIAGWWAAALFQDSTAGALTAVLSSDGGAGATGKQPAIMRYYMTAGTTSSTTFKVRAGPSSAAGTLTFNGFASARVFGGVNLSSITIYEIAV